MPTVRASWGGALASKTRDFAGTQVNPPEKSAPVRTPWAPGAPALAAAARAVDEVVSSGRSAETALAAHEGDAHRAAVRAIALGTIRWYLRLAPALDLLLKHPAGVTGTFRSLLTVAAHQIEYSRNSPEATVHAAVDAARLLGAERATGLANAVLRRFVAERGALLGRVDTELPPRTAHPAWVVERHTLLRAGRINTHSRTAGCNSYPDTTGRNAHRNSAGPANSHATT